LKHKNLINKRIILF